MKVTTSFWPLFAFLLCLVIFCLTTDATLLEGRIPSPRIVGGTEVEKGKYPFFVHLSRCGGTLIHGDIVLTAAHCIKSVEVETAQIGASIRGSTTDGSIYATIIDKIAHPKFLDGDSTYDFTILKIGAWVPNNVISLNSDFSVPPEKSELITMGFGATEEGGEESDVLLETQVAPVNAKDCKKIYSKFDFDEATMICALESGSDSCSGDSGGPLIYENKFENVQIGITSWGAGCARLPGVYARVSAVYDWIAQQICDASSQPPSTCISEGDDHSTHQKQVRIDFQYSDSAADTSWEIVDSERGAPVVSFPAGNVTTDNVLVSSYMSLDSGSYELRMKGRGFYHMYILGKEYNETLWVKGSKSKSFDVDPPPSPSSTGPTMSPQPSLEDRTTVQVEIDVDGFPQEVSWRIIDFNGKDATKRIKAGHYIGTGSFKTNVELEPSSVYTFIVTESTGRSNARFQLTGLNDDKDLGGDQSDRVVDSGGKRIHRSHTFVV